MFLTRCNGSGFSTLISWNIKRIFFLTPEGERNMPTAIGNLKETVKTHFENMENFLKEVQGVALELKGRIAISAAAGDKEVEARMTKLLHLLESSVTDTAPSGT